MNKGKIIFLVFLAMVISLPVWADNLRIPETAIVVPDQSVPAYARAFSGRWRGRWSSWECPSNDGLDAVLIVKEVTGNKARCLYSWGNAVGWDVEPGCSPDFWAEIEKRGEKVVLTWKSKGGSIFLFWVENGKLKGKKGGEDSPYEVIMSRF